MTSEQSHLLLGELYIYVSCRITRSLWKCHLKNASRTSGQSQGAHTLIWNILLDEAYKQEVGLFCVAQHFLCVFVQLCSSSLHVISLVCVFPSTCVRDHYFIYNPIHLFMYICLCVIGHMHFFLQSCTRYLCPPSRGPRGQVCGSLCFISVEMSQAPSLPSLRSSLRMKVWGHEIREGCSKGRVEVMHWQRA